MTDRTARQPGHDERCGDVFDAAITCHRVDARDAFVGATGPCRQAGTPIVRVVALELPHMNPVDVQLSGPAAKQLAREVVRTQRADVDAVSGATYTSEGYVSSLQSSLRRLS